MRGAESFVLECVVLKIRTRGEYAHTQKEQNTFIHISYQRNNIREKWNEEEGGERDRHGHGICTCISMDIY